MGHCRSSATGAHLHDALKGNTLQATTKTLGEPQAIGVVADAFAVLQHDRVHRPNASGFW
ncbi:hypothetical protein D3C85_1940600 [compost metagenome]